MFDLEDICTKIGTPEAMRLHYSGIMDIVRNTSKKWFTSFADMAGGIRVLTGIHDADQPDSIRIFVGATKWFSPIPPEDPEIAAITTIGFHMMPVIYLNIFSRMNREISLVPLHNVPLYCNCTKGIVESIVKTRLTIGDEWDDNIASQLQQEQESMFKRVPASETREHLFFREHLPHQLKVPFNFQALESLLFWKPFGADEFAYPRPENGFFLAPFSECQGLKQ